jgi:tripartite-type tricarboxylate transporter receptor subunit TctC
MSTGVPVQYLMMRAIFMAGGTTPAQVAFYTQLLERVRALPEWKALMTQGAFKQTMMAGQPFMTWLDRAESFHKVLMREARFLPGSIQPAAAASAASAPRR